MRFVLGSNIWSHYQMALAREIQATLGGDSFRFVLFEPMHEDRVGLRWEDGARQASWVVGPPADAHDAASMANLCLSADIAVLGAVPRVVMLDRVASGKLTFVAEERRLKKPWHRLRLANPRYLRGVREFRRMANHPNVHSLAIGQHAAEDLRTIGAYGDRVWDWAYFPDVHVSPPPARKAGCLRVLWAGRMLDWKRVDLIIRAVHCIHLEPWFGECRLLGAGPAEPALRRLAEQLGLTPRHVVFEPPAPIECVLDRMRTSDVLVLASNRHEGWGVVANEAMSEGCVVLANDQAGCARILVEHGKTGLLFRDGNHHELASLLRLVATDAALYTGLRQGGWEHVSAVWHPRIAARRLIALAEALLGREAPPRLDTGPCRRNAAVHSLSHLGTP